MAFPPAVVADADVLFGATTRGLLTQLDCAGLLHLHWSALILDEKSRALVKSKRKPDIASAKAHQALMDRSLPNAPVGYRGVRLGIADHQGGQASAHAVVARKAAWTARTSEGCRVPSFGVCPCGAAGGTENHSVVYGRSRACFRLNFVS